MDFRLDLAAFALLAFAPYRLYSVGSGAESTTVIEKVVI